MSGVGRSFMDRAICRDMADDEIDTFYPEHAAFATTAEFEMAVNKAKVICSRCPVTAQCLAYGIATGQQHGIWGGRTEIERAQLLQRAAAGSGGVSA